MDTGQDFVPYAILVNNPDGSVSLQLANGGFAGQEPGLYGARHDQDPGGAPQQYQRASLNGSVLTFMPLSPDQDTRFVPMGYLAYVGQVYS